MPSLNTWGPPVWTFIHALAENVREDKFGEIKGSLFGTIKNICSFLPCPECSLHAKYFLNKINIQKINDKNEFRTVFYLFHNVVNKKNNKPLYSFSQIQKYKSVHVMHAFNQFVRVYNTKGNMNLLTDTFHRGMVVKNTMTFLKNNVACFHFPNSTQ